MKKQEMLWAQAGMAKDKKILIGRESGSCHSQPKLTLKKWCSTSYLNALQVLHHGAMFGPSRVAGQYLSDYKASKEHCPVALLHGALHDCGMVYLE